jgi:glycosyltransferase involved in cell wall biosynthesis
MNQQTRGRALFTSSKNAFCWPQVHQKLKQMPVTVSIIICTRNRAESLRPTLESIGKAEVPAGWNVELLVVDNGSSDHTHAVVREARLSGIVLRYVHEPTKGLSYARNTGLRETTGGIILFTDDDVRVPLNWIYAMCHPIFIKGADAVAGGVEFPADIDHALTQSALSSCRSWFAATEELDPVRPATMVGANMAFHRRVLDRVPGYDVELGAGALGSGEETLFSKQLLEADFKLTGAIDVAVEHHFDLTRLTKENVIESARNMGRAHAFIFYHWEHQRTRFAFARLVLARIRRCGAQYFQRPGGNTDKPVPFKNVLQIEEENAFYREYTVQSRRRHKYALRGLTPLWSNSEA